MCDYNPPPNTPRFRRRDPNAKLARVRRALLLLTLCLSACGGIAENTPEGDTDEEERPDCSDNFTEPQVLFEEPGWIAQALTPAANGLEFFYARLALDVSLDDSRTRLPTLRTRPSVDADFGPPVTLTFLASACEQVRAGTEFAGMDLSLDGKRLYMTCSSYSRAPNSTGPLLLFERGAMGEPFERSPRIVGEVGISVGLTRDELTAYGTSLDPAVTGVLRYRRAAAQDAFGPGEIVPGITRLANPEPSPDGRTLWGALAVPGSLSTQIVAAPFNEQTQSYDEPLPIFAPPPERITDVSPALLSDCRAAYFVRVDVGAAQISRVMVARR
jgi:hypothetical protein